MAPATQMAARPPRGGSSFRVLRTARVAPSSPDGVPSLRERAVPLTFLDAIWLQSPPVDRVFLYRVGADDVDAVLSRLADSLSRVLHVFYPLAGRLRLTPGKTNRYELFYQPGDGVAFTVAEHDGVGVRVDELAADDPREVAKIAQLVPELPDGGAVLAVQVTVLLPARRGLALGVTVHHAACDGSSSTHFLHTWAAACAGTAVMLPKPPIVDHTFIREREDLYDVMVNRTKEFEKFISPHVADNKLLATFTLSGEILQSIKDRVAGVAARRGAPPPRCTSIVATFAIIWQCHIRAALSDVEVDKPRNHGRVHFVFPTDHRARMEPRVPDKYLGNCVGPCFASAPKKEIAATDADGLFTTCSAIAAAIDEGTRYDPDYWERCSEHVKEMSTSDGAPLSVAGSPRFRVYDVDFGFGRPAKVDVVSVAKTGAISVAEGRAGSGGIEVGIALSPEMMERFRRCFADAVAWLSSLSSSNK
uniref:Uncharacterized protein n=1 Tax=Oryza punctata TaxID=4537 RepID=A0A0E0JZV3_ORYPU